MAMGDATVLVVDDEPQLRLLCRVNLELEGFRVFEAASLAAARDLLETELVHVVVLDVHVGADDGRNLLGELRAAGSPVRVALLTGSADPTNGGFDAADRVLTKPFEPLDLIASVRELAADARVDSAT